MLYPPYRKTSRRIGRSDALGDLGALFSLNDADVILPLQVQPELRAVTEVAAEPHRGVGRDRAAKIENIGDAARRDADIERQPVGA